MVCTPAFPKSHALTVGPEGPAQQLLNRPACPWLGLARQKVGKETTALVVVLRETSQNLKLVAQSKAHRGRIDDEVARERHLDAFAFFQGVRDHLSYIETDEMSFTTDFGRLVINRDLVFDVVRIDELVLASISQPVDQVSVFDRSIGRQIGGDLGRDVWLWISEHVGKIPFCWVSA